MSYLGNNPNKGSFFQQKFTGDGSTTAFTLLQSVTDGSQLIITIGNVIQEEGSGKAYTASGTTLTFDSAPANNDVIVVRYLGRSLDTPTTYATQITYKYVATNAQTAFSGSDANGNTLSYTIGSVDVYLNGVHLDTTDFTETNESTITLASGATTNDELVIVAKRTITLTDVVPKSSGGTFAGDVIAGGALTVNGAFTANAGVNVDNITIDGTEIDLSSGDLTLDVAGNIFLNADGGDIRLVDGSTQFGVLQNNSNNLVIQSSQSGNDVIFKGNDSGGSAVTALTLDMSDSGTALFNDKVILAQDKQLQFVDTNESIRSDGSQLILKSGGNSFIIPTSDGSNGQFLQTDGAGNMSFATVSTSTDINGTTATTDIASGDEVLIYDASATANAKITASNFIKSGAFHSKNSVGTLIFGQGQQKSAGQTTSGGNISFSHSGTSPGGGTWRAMGTTGNNTDRTCWRRIS